MPQCRIFLETHNQHEYHVHTARAPSLPQTMARNVIEVSNSLNDTNKKRKCLLRRNVVNVLDAQVPIPDPPVGVVENDTPALEPLPDIVDHTADWDDTNSTADDLCIQQTINKPWRCRSFWMI